MSCFSNPDHSIRWATGCRTTVRIEEVVGEMLGTCGLPPRLASLILIKPNLNNDLSALTGNSADLRVLAALIRTLKMRGYGNIVLADGPNIGAFRKGIDVFARLGVTALAERLGVELLDLNRAPSAELRVATGTVRVAEICLRADFLISVPKIKTHAEAGMSAAVKNQMGCVAGTDKWLMHADLPANLVRLNELVRPHLVLVDGLFAMEGNGPGDGSPKRLDLLLAGTDVFRTDLAIARMTGMDWKTIPCLALARSRGLLSDAAVSEADAHEVHIRLDLAPRRGRVTRFLDNRLLKPLRDLTRPIHRSESLRRALHRMGILQDVYEKADARITSIRLDGGLCTRCGLCLDYCPMKLSILYGGFDFRTPECVRCLYCVDVCPVEAIRTEGDHGYLRRHRARFAARVRAAAQCHADAGAQKPAATDGKV